MRSFHLVGWASLFVAFVACGGASQTTLAGDGSGGLFGSGGGSTGGDGSETGGSDNGGTGSNGGSGSGTSIGGFVNAGGFVNTGGFVATGGFVSTGGVVGTGGVIATGGSGASCATANCNDNDACTKDTCAGAGLCSHVTPTLPHSKCTTGSAMPYQFECESGDLGVVAAVCYFDMNCCSVGWDSDCVTEVYSMVGDTTCVSGTCSHDICAQGAYLTSGCSSCVTTICASDPFCCGSGTGANWDDQCVSEVGTKCGLNCAVN